ncbi:MAG: flagellar basal body L-ring protein FlgH, partial [Proteobacteria bacterium]|nr:flagellar basal body L-ring protein FlgH [Pseudomonadota bacterium]
MRNRMCMLDCIVIVGIMAFSGCATPAQKKQLQVHTEDIRGHEFETPKSAVPSEGSLWTDAGRVLLFVDMRAREVGDLVTVRISEKPTGKLYAKTQTSRDSSIEAG